MKIDATKPVKEIVAGTPGALQLFEAMGIDYCCGGEKSLAEACAAAHRSLDEVLKSLEDTPRSESASSPERNWNEASLSAIMQHIVDSHHAYCRQESERITTLLAKVISIHGARHPELKRVQSVFSGMQKDLGQHMLKEEQTLFPMIAEMEEKANRHEAIPLPPFGTIQNPIAMLVLEHDASGAGLKELRSLTGGYQLPADACGTYRNLYEALRAFERDMHQHVWLENDILFPRADALEKSTVRGCSG